VNDGKGVISVLPVYSGQVHFWRGAVEPLNQQTAMAGSEAFLSPWRVLGLAGQDTFSSGYVPDGAFLPKQAWSQRLQALRIVK